MTIWLRVYKQKPNYVCTHFPKSVSFGRGDFAICQYGRRPITTEIEFYIKFIGLIYWPPDMRGRKGICYGYYLNVSFVKFRFQNAYKTGKNVFFFCCCCFVRMFVRFGDCGIRACGNDGRNTVMCVWSALLPSSSTCFMGLFALHVLFIAQISTWLTRAQFHCRAMGFIRTVCLQWQFIMPSLRGEFVPTQTPAHSHTRTYRHTRRTGYLTFDNVALNSTLIGPEGAFGLGWGRSEMFTVELKVLIAGAIDIKIDCVIIYSKSTECFDSLPCRIKVLGWWKIVTPTIETPYYLCDRFRGC